MGPESKFQCLPRRTYALVALLVLTTVGATAWFFYGRAKERVERQARENLLFIDRLKGDQLNGWLRQRQGDAAFVSKNTVNDNHVGPFLAGVNVDENRRKSLAWLETIQRNSFYRSVVLADTNGEVRLTFGPADMTLTAREKVKVLETARSGACSFDTLHVANASGYLHTVFYVPVLRYDRPGCLGVMMLEVDPEDFLFAMIRHDPMATRSGESLLVERDGNEAVIVLPKTGENRSAAPMRYALSETNVPAVMAVNGCVGLVEGVDYRGNAVMAVLRPVSGTPWILETKIDKAELFAPLRRESALITASSLTILLVLSLLTFAWQRRREARFYRLQAELEQMQREQEKAALDQRHFFERIFEQTLAGYWDWSIPEKRVMMSPRFKAMLGYGDGEIPNTQEAWQRLVCPDDLPMLAAAFEKHVSSRGQEPYNIELRYQHKDGSTVWVICAGLVIAWDEAGQPVRMVGCHTDLTSRKRAEAAMRESEKRFLDLVNHAPIPVGVLSNEGRLTQVNGALSKLFGYSLHDLPTLQDWWKSAYPDPAYRREVAQIWKAAVRTAAATDGIIKTVESRVTLKDGRVRIMETSGFLTAECTLVMFVDVTERYEVERVLRESEERFRTLADAAFEGIVISEQSVIVDCNPRFAEMFGGRRERMVGLNITDFMLPEEKTEIMAMIQGGETGVIEAHALRLDGSVMSVEARGRSFTRGGKSLRIEAIRDVTAYKDAEALLERKVKERTADLQFSNRALQMMLACNRVVLQAQNEEEMLQRVCATLVQVGGYKLSWVGYKVADEEKSVRPVAQFGFEQGYIASLHMSWADNPRGCGPTGRAIRTGSAVACRDILNDPNFAPWRERALACGYASSIALPLTLDGNVEGALMCYASQPFAFDEDEIRLLGSLADDLSFGIQSLRIRQAHDRAEKELALHRDHLEEEVRLRTAALHQSEAKLRSLFAAMTDLIFVLDKDGRYLEIAPTSPHLLYRPPAEILGKTVHELFPAEQADLFVRHVRDALATHLPVTMEYSLPIRGRRVWFLATLSALSDDSVMFVGRDITVIKRAELALRASEARYRALFSSSSDGIFLYQFVGQQSSSRFLDVSDQGCLMMGYSRSELLQKTPLDLRHPTVAADFANILQELVEKKHCLYESLLVAKDGHAIPVEINCTLFDLEQQPTVIATVRDIAERKKFEAELR